MISPPSSAHCRNSRRLAPAEHDAHRELVRWGDHDCRRTARPKIADAQTALIDADRRRRESPAAQLLARAKRAWVFDRDGIRPAWRSTLASKRQSLRNAGGDDHVGRARLRMPRLRASQFATSSAERGRSTRIAIPETGRATGRRGPCARRAARPSVETRPSQARRATGRSGTARPAARRRPRGQGAGQAAGALPAGGRADTPEACGTGATAGSRGSTDMASPPRGAATTLVPARPRPAT